MNALPDSPNVFAFKMETWLPLCYTSYLRWLRGLLERLGHDCTLAIWEEACQSADDALLHQVLSAGWQADPREGLPVEQTIAALLPQVFPETIQGVTAEQARSLVERMPPIQQIRQTLPALNEWKDTTAQQALHLRLHGIALLSEALIRHHGKQGELIAYDLLREGRLRAQGGRTCSVAEFIKDFVAEPEEANLFSVGLATEVVRATASDAVLHVRECAWARYFHQYHPSVGYLVACSTDEVAYRAFNADLRLQRTSTLMEGGEVCDFRIFSVSQDR